MSVTRYKRQPDAAERARNAVLGVMNARKEPAKPASPAEPAAAARKAGQESAPSSSPRVMRISENARSKARQKGGKQALSQVTHEAVSRALFKPYEPPPGVLPPNLEPKAAMDSQLEAWAQTGYTNVATGALFGVQNAFVSAFQEGVTFLGYAYLAELTQRPEYRRISERIAIEMTRKWIRLTVSSDDTKDENEDGVDDDTGEQLGTDAKRASKKRTRRTKKDLDKRVKEIDEELRRLNVREAFKKVAENDGWMGRAHIYLDTGDTNDLDELRTPIGDGADEVSVAKFGGERDFLKAVKPVEAIWCYPSRYNASDPLQPDWYNPSMWFCMAKELHCSRLLTFVGREVPDILKPAYAFGGLALSQMAKPYVDNWLRTRQAVADLIESFSVSGIYTNMQGALSGSDGEEVFARVDMFNNTRSNRGSMVLDKDTEEFFNISTPLGTLDHLQAQSQEQMSSVCGIPIVVLLGITPTGLNASSEGEIRVFYDFIHAFQEQLFRRRLQTVINFVQLSKFGDVAPEIGFEFEPLWALDEKGEAEVNKIKAETGVILVDGGVISTEEERSRLAKDPGSGYDGLDPADLPPEPEPPLDGPNAPDPFSNKGETDDGDDSGFADDASPFVLAGDAFNEADHPRVKGGAEAGQFAPAGGDVGTVEKMLTPDEKAFVDKQYG